MPYLIGLLGGIVIGNICGVISLIGLSFVVSDTAAGQLAAGVAVVVCFASWFKITEFLFGEAG